MRRLSGMTLIELLLAFFLAVLLAAVGLSVYFTVSGSLRRQQDRRWQSAATALEMVRKDLACCLPATPDGQEPFALDCVGDPMATNTRSALRCLTVVVPTEQPTFERLEAVRVRYAVHPLPDGQGQLGLWREALPLTGTGRPAVSSNLLFGGVSAFEVRVMLGGTWTNRWQSTVRQPLPQAATLRIAWPQQRLEVILQA